jgi:hypothetical protein
LSPSEENPYNEVDVEASTMENPVIGSGPDQNWAPPQIPMVGAAARSDEPRSSRIRDLDLRNTWQVLAGAILLPLGIAVIIIGWHGAAYGNVDQKQIPYLISGGILGLAIVIIGCFFYWAHWLYRIYDQADLHHQEAMREQTEMIRALLEAVQQRPGGPAEAAASPAGEVPTEVGAALSNGSAPTFLATPTGTNFHASGCPMIANRMANARLVTAKEAEAMRPCRVCEPLATH